MVWSVKCLDKTRQYVLVNILDSAKSSELYFSGVRRALPGVQSSELYFTDQSLWSEETQALVRAMETGISQLELNEWVTLDFVRGPDGVQWPMGRNWESIKYLSL